MSKKCALILAAGEGRRMKTSKPKVLAEVLFKPMIDWVTDAVREGGVDEICVVTGHCHEELEAHLGGKFRTVVQSELLGTGHAVMQAKEFIKANSPGNILIINGDAPLIDAKTISTAFEYHESHKNAVTIISAKIDNPFGYGRIIRNKDKCLKRIVEENDATNAEKMINEVNSGAYWFKTADLLDFLGKLTQNNVQGEYYLTDTVGIAVSEGKRAGAYMSDNSDVILGANDRKGLLDLNTRARMAVIGKHLDNGIEFNCIDGVIIERSVEIEAGTEILSGTIIRGNTKIGANCKIGPSCMIEDCTIGENAKLNNVQAYNSEIKAGSELGPWEVIKDNK